MPLMKITGEPEAEDGAEADPKKTAPMLLAPVNFTLPQCADATAPSEMVKMTAQNSLKKRPKPQPKPRPKQAKNPGKLRLPAACTLDSIFRQKNLRVSSGAVRAPTCRKSFQNPLPSSLIPFD